MPGKLQGGHRLVISHQICDVDRGPAPAADARRPSSARVRRDAGSPHAGGGAQDTGRRTVVGVATVSHQRPASASSRLQQARVVFPRAPADDAPDHAPVAHSAPRPAGEPEASDGEPGSVAFLEQELARVRQRKQALLQQEGAPEISAGASPRPHAEPVMHAPSRPAPARPRAPDGRPRGCGGRVAGRRGGRGGKVWDRTEYRPYVKQREENLSTYAGMGGGVEVCAHTPNSHSPLRVCVNVRARAHTHGCIH